MSFSRTDTGLCIYQLFVWSNLNFLQISQWITLPTQSCLVLYSFCAHLLHSLIMWLIVSSLSSHNLPFLFCCVLSILSLIWVVLMTLFYAAIRRDSVSLLKFPFLNHGQDFLSESSQVSRTLLSILADLKSAVVWMVSIRFLISKSSSPRTNPLMTVSRAPLIIGITVTFMCHSFFNSQARSRYVSFFLLSFYFTLWSTGTVKLKILQIYFFFFLFFFFFWLVWSSGRD